MHVHLSVYVSICTYICMCLFAHVHVCVHVQLHMCVYLYVCVCKDVPKTLDACDISANTDLFILKRAIGGKDLIRTHV